MRSPVSPLRAWLDDPLIAPEGMLEWLSWIEPRATDLLDAIERRIENGDALALLREQQASLRRFLFDAEDGGLARLRRFTKGQLAPGNPVGAAYRRQVESALSRAEAALECQGEADQFIAELRAVESRVAHLLPWNWSQGRKSASLTDDDIGAIASIGGVARARRRLRWLSDQLARLSDATLTLPAPASERAADSAAPTALELGAMRIARMRERAAIEQRLGTAANARDLARSQYDALLAASGRAAGGLGAKSLLAKDLAARAAADMAVHQSDDLHLWRLLLEEASTHLSESLRRDRWVSADRNPLAHKADAAASESWFVVPLGAGWVWITRAHRSAVQLERVVAPQVGERVTARAIGAPDEWISSPLAALDLPPLFEGFEERFGAWYTTRRAAQLRIILRDGDDVYANVERTGELERQPDAAWRPVAAVRGALHVLPPRSLADAASEYVVGPDPVALQEGRSILGFRTQPVRAPFSDVTRAWLRTAEPATAARKRALEAEWGLFVTLRANAPAARYPEPIGRAHLEGDDAGGFLYREPLVASGQQESRLKAWMDVEPSARRSAVATLAQAALGIRAAGHAVGVYHASVLGISVNASDPGDSAVVLTLLHAPLATPIGSEFSVSLPLRSLQRLEYPGAGFRGLIPAAAEGEVADEFTDAAALSLFIAEAHLANRPEPDEWLSWEGACERLVNARADECLDGIRVREIGAALQRRDAGWLWKRIEEMSEWSPR